MAAEQGQRLSAANAKFALDLYKLHTSPADKNIFMSPVSISVALAMTYLGARGQTKSQMRDVLHFIDVDKDCLHQAFTNIQSALNKPDQSYKLYMANRLFGEKSYTFLAEFLAAGRKHYAAELAAVDFRNDSSGAAAAINNWVAENTNNKVTEILPESAIDNLTRLVLVNAVYFKGDWLEKFEAQYTKDEDFHVSPKETVRVKMMYREEVNLLHGFSEELQCQAIELPYVGDTLSMVIILPDNKAISLAEVEKKLTFDELVNVTEKFRMRRKDVNLWLPRFHLDEKLSLAEILSGMGMKDLFMEGAADLSGIDGTKELCVSKVLHRAVVDVNEEGTEAAAATAVGIVLCCYVEPNVFCADHPFLFFIQDKSTKSVLFLGRLARPPAA